MKILIANCHRSIVGGAERYLQAIIPEFLGRNYKIAILHTFRRRPGAETIDPAATDLPCWQIEGTSSAQLQDQILRWQPDLVFGHGLEPVSFEQWLAGTFPFVAFIHNYSHTCPTGRKYNLLPVIRSCDRIAGPVCLLLHYPLGCGGLNPGRLWNDYLQQSARRLLLSRYRQVLVASSHMHSEILRHAGIESRLRLVTLPVTGIEPLPSPPAPKTPAGTLVVTGRLTNVKGTDYLIRAVPLASRMTGKELRLIVAGDGAELDNLKKLAVHTRVPVEFRGWLDRAAVSRLMHDADLLAVPSLWPEPFGMVGIEAGCAGTPSVGFALGGITDWLIPGTTGELAPGNPPAVDGLAAAISRALTDVDHYNHLRSGAWLYAKGRSVLAHVDELEDVFGRLAAGQATAMAH